MRTLFIDKTARRSTERVAEIRFLVRLRIQKLEQLLFIVLAE